MSQKITKNQVYRYFLFGHEAYKDVEGHYYCRAINDVLSGEYFLCKDCPLCGELIPGENGENIPLCWYFDMYVGYSNDLTPGQQKSRIHGMIMAGMTEEFPEYLEEDAKAEQFLVLEKAIRFAAKAHKGAYRKGSKLPYIVHPIQTMMLAARMTDDVDVIAAAALHDVVEDTIYTAEDLKREFGPRIAELVLYESENKREGQAKTATWKIRKQENLEREKTAPIGAKIIMLADKISNMRSTLVDFRKNGDIIWQKFNCKDKKEQEWYYRGVAEVLSDLKDQPLYGEYLEILDEVFGKDENQG